VKRAAAVTTLLLCMVLVAVILPGLMGVSAQEAGGWRVLKSFATGVTAAASGEDGSWLIATGSGVLGSVDGRSFRRLSSSLDGLDVQTAAIMGDRWFLGTDGDGLYVSDDAGVSWRRDASLDCVTISSIRADKFAAGGLYVASLCRGLYWSPDGGRTWAGRGKGITTFLVADVFQLSSTEVIVATRDKGLFRSADGGKSFSAVASASTSASWLAGDQATGLIVAASDQKVMVSTNRGTSWKGVALPTGTVVTGLAVTPQGRLLLGTAAQGMLLSANNGATWDSARTGSSSRTIAVVGTARGLAFYGSAEGECATWTTDEPFLSVSSTDVQLGTVPTNQRRTATLQVRNLGVGTMAYRFENVPAYLAIEPATGTAGTATVTLSVTPMGMGMRSYQNVIRVVSDGGEQFVTVRFEVVPEAPLHMELVVGQKSALVGGTGVALDAAPYIDKASGRTFVPVRFIGESFGAKVTWSAALQKVWLQLEASPQHPAILVELRIASTTALVNGTSVALDAAPRIVSGRTFVPLRFIGEAFGAQVSWTAATRTIAIDFMP
jgi:hypothetical protein